MGRLAGKVALISGGARGQGRSHAITMAKEGADIVMFDICKQIQTVPYQMSSRKDLEETVESVQQLGRKVVGLEADARNTDEVTQVVQKGLEEFGKIDIVVANAGIGPAVSNAWQLTDEAWDDVIDTNLTGAYKTVRAAIPHMIESGNGGSIVLTASTLGLTGATDAIPYVVSKHGIVGLMRSLAMELAPYWIRVNSIHPTCVDTPALVNDTNFALVAGGDASKANEADFRSSLTQWHLLPIPHIEPVDVSNAIVWLSSDEARFVTGISLPIDAGFLLK